MLSFTTRTTLVALLVLATPAQASDPAQILDEMRLNFDAIDKTLGELRRQADELEALLPPPVVQPEANWTAACTLLVCSFTDQSTPKGGIVAWQWDFGDGSPISSEQNPSHTYGAGGSYQVTLTVADNEGTRDALAALVSVTEPPVPPDPDRDRLADCIASLAPFEWSGCGGEAIDGAPGGFYTQSELAQIAQSTWRWAEKRGPENGIFGGWTGGVICGGPTGDALWVWGGGHEAYGGSELYYYDLATLRWHRTANVGTGDPAPGVPAYNGRNWPTGDGGVNPRVYPYTWMEGQTVAVGTVLPLGVAPSTWHYYGSAACDTTRDLIWTGGGFHWTPNTGKGYSGPDARVGTGTHPEPVFRYDPMRDRWTFMRSTTCNTAMCKMAYDPVTDRILHTYPSVAGGTKGVTALWAAEGGHYQGEQRHTGWSNGVALVMTGSDGRRYYVGAERNGIVFRMEILAGNRLGTARSCNKGIPFGGAGMAARGDKVWMWNGQTLLRELDPVACVATDHAFTVKAGETMGAPTDGAIGPYGKFQYLGDAGYDAFIGMMSKDQPPWIFVVESADPPDPPVPPDPPNGALLPLPQPFACSDFDSNLPNCPNLQTLVDQTPPGGTLTLTPGSYGSCAVLRNDIVIEAAGAHTAGGVCLGKATFVMKGDLTIRNWSCDAPGAAGGSGNEACIRRDPGAGHLELYNVWMRDGTEGVLGSDGTSVDFRHVIAERLGGAGGKSHVFYMAAGTLARVTDSQIRCPVDGHGWKGGFDRTEFLRTVISSVSDSEGNKCPGAGSREVDSFGGELSFVESTIEKAAWSKNSTQIGYGQGPKQQNQNPVKSLVFVDNLVICDRAPTKVFVPGYQSPATITESGNRYSGAANCQDRP